MREIKVQRIAKIMIICIIIFSVFMITDKIFSMSQKENVGYEVKALDKGDASNVIPTVSEYFEKQLKYKDENKMIEHYDVKGIKDNKNIYGYVQIWKSEDSLNEYLKICREYMSYNAFGFSEIDIRINNIVWKKWEYIVDSIFVAQGFCEQNGRIYLCSIFVPYQEKTNDFDKFFLDLLQDVA